MLGEQSAGSFVERDEKNARNRAGPAKENTIYYDFSERTLPRHADTKDRDDNNSLITISTVQLV